MHQYRGKLILHCGSMFSGKTSALYKDVTRFKIAKYKVLTAKMDFDKRYSENKIITHDMNGIDCFVFHNIEELESMVQKNPIDVLAIDEIQFINSYRVQFLNLIKRLLTNGLTIILAGLEMDYRAIPFEITKDCFAIADYVNKHHAVCTKCGSDAWVSYRKTDNEDRMLLGSYDIYEPLCRNCFEKEMAKKDSYVNKNQIKIGE